MRKEKSVRLHNILRNLNAGINGLNNLDAGNTRITNKPQQWNNQSKVDKESAEFWRNQWIQEIPSRTRV